MKKHILNKKYFLVLLLSMLFYGYVSVTGPSHITSEISPISINEKGDILCRTRFSKNEMGAHAPMKITYGYCVITADSISQYTTQEVDPNGFPDYETFTKTTSYWDAVFKSSFNTDNLSVIGRKLKKLHLFESSNVSSYKTDKVLPIAEFETNKHIYLNHSPQWALNGAKSTTYNGDKTIHVLYDFGHIVILENDININSKSTGADFDYFNPWTNAKGEIVNIGFDLSKVTGVLRTPK